jgi:RNA polymerase sigma-70 factor, ECF subfamily
MQQPLTSLLESWRAGDAQAADRVLSTVYEELRRLASYYMRQERSGHTLQPTALVHELYLKMFQAEQIGWENRAHFFAAAAQALRRILVNYARDRQAQKRGGKQFRLSLTEASGLSDTADFDVLAIEEALTRLERVDERAARVVELRFFAGMTDAEAAEALGISTATLKRDWSFGRAWLLRHLG